MEVTRPLEIARIEELKILHNVRLIHRHDLNHMDSKDNLRVQFEITGDIRGAVTCYLCLDGHEVSFMDRNYLYPLFVESMNILVGRQLSLDEELAGHHLRISPPKLNMNPTHVSTTGREMTHKYELELKESSFYILAQYSLEALN